MEINYLENESILPYFPPGPIPQSPESFIFQRIVKNPFFWALAIATSAIALIAFSATILTPFEALAFSAFSISILVTTYFFLPTQTRKWLISEVAIMWRLMLQSIPCFPSFAWCHSITPQLTLGAIPLKSHLQNLLASGHSAVLSLIEPHESEPHLFGVPATAEDWSRENVIFLNLPNPDLTPVSARDIDQGVEFIQSQITNQRKVYVHCQAGIGRGATIVLCYLIKYQNMNPKDAAQLISSKRAFTITENHPAVQLFIERLAPNQSFDMPALFPPDAISLEIRRN